MSIPVTSCAASRICWPSESVRADGWKVVMNGSGSCWTVTDVKARPSIGPTKITPPRPSARDDVGAGLEAEIRYRPRSSVTADTDGMRTAASLPGMSRAANTRHARQRLPGFVQDAAFDRQCRRQRDVDAAHLSAARDGDRLAGIVAANGAVTRRQIASAVAARHDHDVIDTGDDRSDSESSGCVRGQRRTWRRRRASGGSSRRKPSTKGRGRPGRPEEACRLPPSRRARTPRRCRLAPCGRVPARRRAAAPEAAG